MGAREPVNMGVCVGVDKVPTPEYPYVNHTVGLMFWSPVGSDEESATGCLEVMQVLIR